MIFNFENFAIAATESAQIEPIQIEEMKIISTVIFALAILHTFSVNHFLHFANRFRQGSVRENLFHFLGEVEVVFGVWAAVLIGIWSLRFGTVSAAHYLESVNFTEAIFVFVIMCMAATRPVITLANNAVVFAVKKLPGPKYAIKYVVVMILGPLLGSFITEPAAMTVTALLLKSSYFEKSMSVKFRYATLGLLFVNVSIGGTLTHFAAPPVLMVASAWDWDTSFMAATFGWRAALAVAIGSIVTMIIFRKELKKIDEASIEAPINTSHSGDGNQSIPWWIVASHIVFMALTIFHAHYVSFFVPLFLLFLGWCTVTKEYQDELRIRESLLVGFFLGGLVSLGSLQGWWIQPLLSSLDTFLLFSGAMTLTAFTDNAAITYLGTLVPNLSGSAKYALVAGAVAGGGLTIIANAPNPAGYGILSSAFGDDGISPLRLFLGALPYTILAALAFLL